MDADRVADALRRFILGPSEPIERRWDLPGAVIIQTHLYQYRAEPATWSIAAEPWVEAAVRVIAEDDRAAMVPTFGLLFTADDVVFLNDVAAMADLGRRVTAGTDPMAYAELLAELQFTNPSGPAGATQEVSWPTADGQLIRDRAAFLHEYPFVDPAVITANRPDPAGGAISFQSYVRYLLADFGSALDILDWTVSILPEQGAAWAFTVTANRIEITG